jgi:RNA polymerase sigma factor (sigma-70 family)
LSVPRLRSQASESRAGTPSTTRSLVRSVIAGSSAAREHSKPGSGGWSYGKPSRHDAVRAAGFSEHDSTRASTNGHLDQTSELLATVALLPERQRLILFLRYYADLDYQQIADTLELRRGTVSAALHSAHQTLRRQLEEMSER